MKYNRVHTSVIDKGKAPLIMEPVRAKFTIPSAISVNILDHDGRRTGKTLPVKNGSFAIDGSTEKTMYYEIIRKPASK